MFSKVDYVMVNVSDMSHSVAFYRDILGLQLKFESPGWSEPVNPAQPRSLHAGTGGLQRFRNPGRALRRGRVRWASSVRGSQ